MTGIPQGSEFAVNTTTSGGQQTFFAPLTNHTPRAVAIDSDGDYVVTWTGQDISQNGIYARRYNKDGVAQDAAEFRVNTTTGGRQTFSSVAMDTDGDFVITWTSSQNDGLGISYGIYAQRYNSAGVVQDGEFLVNAPSSADQNESTIAIDSTGNFIITGLVTMPAAAASLLNATTAQEWRKVGSSGSIQRQTTNNEHLA